MTRRLLADWGLECVPGALGPGGWGRAGQGPPPRLLLLPQAHLPQHNHHNRNQRPHLPCPSYCLLTHGPQRELLAAL